MAGRAECTGKLEVIFPEWLTVNGSCKHLSDVVGQPGDPGFHSLDTQWFQTNISAACKNCRITLSWLYVDADGKSQFVRGPELKPADTWKSPP
jgi:hypothetical protein